MTLRHYFKPVDRTPDGLPDPRGPLSARIPVSAIAAANDAVRDAISEEKKNRHRGKYLIYTPKVRLEIAKYATNHGIASAARVFSHRLKKKVSESTVRSMRNAYREELRKRSEDDDEMPDFPAKKRGRHVLLGDELDKTVQLYLRKTREGGGAVSTRSVVAAARAIVLTMNRSLLKEFGGPIVLNRSWGRSLLKRMDFVQRRATTSKSKFSVENFAEVKKAFLDEVVAIVTMEEVPAELILNWDQTGIRLVPSSSWTMDKRGTRRVEMVGVNDKRQITAVFCGNLLGDFLPVQVIYKGKTPRCHPSYSFPSGWNITHSPKHWSTEQTMLEYIDCIIVPYVEAIRNDLDDKQAAALVIIDNFRGQVTDAVKGLLESHGIHMCLLPANTTDRLQPMDVAVNKPAKDFIKGRFEEWYTEQVVKQLNGKNMEDLERAEIDPINLSMPVIKNIGAKWIAEMAEYISNNPQFIVNGFNRSGITGAVDGTMEESDEDSEDDGNATDSTVSSDSEEDDDDDAESGTEI